MEALIRPAIIFASVIVLMQLSDLIFNKVIKRSYKIHVKFTQGLVKAVIVIIGVVAVGMQFAVTKDISASLVKNTALLVAVLGFAAQQTLNDMLSGLMISWFRPFDIGARIYLVSKDITGIVEDITLRHTVIRGFDNNRIIIPNSIINKEILKNSDYQDSMIGNYLEVKVSCSNDIHMVMELMDKMIREHPMVLTDETYKPGILVKDFDRESFLMKATVWTKTVNENFEACSEIRIALRKVFLEQNIEMV